MARYFGTMQGQGLALTCTGLRKSGAWGHIRSYEVGGKVEIGARADDSDLCHLTVTGGSNGSSQDELNVAAVLRTPEGGTFMRLWVPDEGWRFYRKVRGADGYTHSSQAWDRMTERDWLDAMTVVEP